MKEDMNQYFDQMMEQGTIPHKPVLNEICAAQKRGENTLHRVRIESMSTQNRGHQAICYLIDEGSEITVSTRRLMKLPKKFREFPVQVHQCCLWGIQPLSLKVEEGDMGLDAKHRPSYKWDPSAVQYMRKMMEESKGCQAEIVAKDADDIYYVRLYFMTRKDLFASMRSWCKKSMQ